MSQAIINRIKAILPDQAQSQKLKFVPILGVSSEQPPYELLRDETLNFVQVTEISQHGSVPKLSVLNNLNVSVFLMDGQELVGAKQNRILNTDVLVAAQSAVTIPVSCVEQGRWRNVGRAFAFRNGKFASLHGRSTKLTSVYQNLKSSGHHDASQGEVWSEVAKLLEESGTSSPTHALSDAYAKRDPELRALRSSLKIPDKGVGLAVFHGEEFKGLDLFDRHSALQYFWDSLVDSYAIELLEAPVDPAQPASDQGQVIRSVLDQVIAGKWESFNPPGEGKDWRMEGNKFTAASLVWNDEAVIHLQVFPTQPAGKRNEPTYRPRVRSS